MSGNRITSYKTCETSNIKTLDGCCTCKWRYVINFQLMCYVVVSAGADHSLVHRFPVADPGVFPGLPGGEGRRLHGRVQPRKPHSSVQTTGF